MSRRRLATAHLFATATDPTTSLVTIDAWLFGHPPTLTTEERVELEGIVFHAHAEYRALLAEALDAYLPAPRIQELAASPLVFVREALATTHYDWARGLAYDAHPAVRKALLLNSKFRDEFLLEFVALSAPSDAVIWNALRERADAETPDLEYVIAGKIQALLAPLRETPPGAARLRHAARMWAAVLATGTVTQNLVEDAQEFLRVHELAISKKAAAALAQEVEWAQGESPRRLEPRDHRLLLLAAAENTPPEWIELCRDFRNGLASTSMCHNVTWMTYVNPTVLRLSAEACAPGTSAARLQALARSPLLSVRQVLVRNPATPAPVLARLLANPADAEIQVALLDRPTASEDDLLEIPSLPSVRNEGFTHWTHWVVKLLKHPTSAVKSVQRAARYAREPGLAEDQMCGVWEALAMHAAATPAVLLEAATVAATALAGTPEYPDTHHHTLLAVATHASAPDDALAYCLSHGDATTRGRAFIALGARVANADAMIPRA